MPTDAFPPWLPLQVLVVVETRSAEHAREMFQVLRSKYKGGMTIAGAGGALGVPRRAGHAFSDEDLRSDSGLTSEEEEEEREGGGGGGGRHGLPKMKLPILRSRRNSLQHSITEISVP